MITTEVKDMSKARENPMRLVTYLRFGKENLKDNEKNRVLFSGTLNLESTDLDEAAFEMQSLVDSAGKENKKHFKHLIISLRAGEHLSEVQWFDCIKTHLLKLDLQEHQVIFAVHKDTDNEHVHLLINRINPNTRKLNRLSFSHKKEQQADAICEERYKLKADPHPLYKGGETKTKAETKAADYEAVTARQSLLSYVKSFENELFQAQSWADLHNVFNRHGIELKKSGRGLVILAKNPDKDPYEEYIGLKASNISRKTGQRFTLAELGKKFGPYVEITNKENHPKEVYQGKPTGFQKNDKVLVFDGAVKDSFTRYQTFLAETQKARDDVKSQKALLADLRRQQLKKLYAEYKRNEKACIELYRNDLQVLHKHLAQCKELYDQSCTQVRKDFNQKLKDLSKNTKDLRKLSFMDYLRNEKDHKYDESIRNILLSRQDAMKQQEENFIFVRNQAFKRLDRLMNMAEAKYLKRSHKGMDLYKSRRFSDVIKDDGLRLFISADPVSTTVRDLFKIGIKRYGIDQLFEVRGSISFQLHCAIESAFLGMKIHSTSSLINNFFKIREEENERHREEQIRSGTYLRRIGDLGRSSRTGRRSAARRSIGSVNGRSSLFGSERLFESEHLVQRNVTSKRNPTFSHLDDYQRESTKTNAYQERDMSEMSKRHVDAETGGSNVLLQTHEQNKLGVNQMVGLFDGMRREIRSPEGRRNLNLPKEVEDYITDRNKRFEQGLKGTLQHEIWNGQNGPMLYTGLRHLGDHNFVLLQQNNMIYIKEIQDNILSRVKSLKRGQNVRVDKNGYITFTRSRKGR